MDLAYFDAVGKAKTPKDPIEPPRYAGFACEPTRPPLSDHVTPRLRITSVTASVAASVEAGGSEGGPAETCAEKSLQPLRTRPRPHTCGRQARGALALTGCRRPIGRPRDAAGVWRPSCVGCGYPSVYPLSL